MYAQELLDEEKGLSSCPGWAARGMEVAPSLCHRSVSKGAQGGSHYLSRRLLSSAKRCDLADLNARQGLYCQNWRTKRDFSPTTKPRVFMVCNCLLVPGSWLLTPLFSPLVAVRSGGCARPGYLWHVVQREERATVQSTCLGGLRGCASCRGACVGWVAG